jgi:hypothetical protein
VGVAVLVVPSLVCVILGGLCEHVQHQHGSPSLSVQVLQAEVAAELEKSGVVVQMESDQAWEVQTGPLG